MGFPAELPYTGEADRSHLWARVERSGRVVARACACAGRLRWGPRLDLELPYPVPGVEAREDLFAPVDGRAALVLREGMLGELSVGPDRIALDRLDDWGLVRTARGRRYVVVTPAMEGRLEYRGLTVRFAYGPPPARREPSSRERVPLRFRRSLLAREDRAFALLSWLLYGVAAGLALWLAGLPVPEAPRPEAVAQRFAKLIYEAPQAPSRARTELLKKQAEEEAARGEETAEPEPEAQPEVREEPPPAAPEAPQAEERAPPAPEPAVPVETAREDGAAGEARRDAIRKKVAAKGLLGYLGGRGAASTSRVSTSILSGGGAAGDLDRVLENVDGLRTAAPVREAPRPLLPGRAEDGLPNIDEAALRDVAASDRTVELQARAEERVEAPVESPSEAFDLKEAVAVIHRVVGTYLGGIRYLYNRELRKNPELEGKLTVSITIGAAGEVVECHVVESTLAAPGLEEAVLDRIRKWKFPPVAPRDVTVTYPFVFFPSM